MLTSVWRFEEGRWRWVVPNVFNPLLQTFVAAFASALIQHLEKCEHQVYIYLYIYIYRSFVGSSDRL